MRWDWRPPLGFVIAAVACLAGGLTVASSALVGLLVAGVVLLVTRLDGAPDPGWERPHYDRRHGARGEVQDLAWAMVGRDGRVGERVLRQLRDVAGAGSRGTDARWTTPTSSRSSAPAPTAP